MTARYNRVVVLSDLLARCPVPAAGVDAGQILVIVPNPAAEGRLVARPIDSEDRLRRGCFGGNFVYSSDQRFTEAFGNHPIPVHDRFESQPRSGLRRSHDLQRRLSGSLQLLSRPDRVSLLTDLLMADLGLESQAVVDGYYWGRNRGGRHVGLVVRKHPGSIEGNDAIRLAPRLRRTQAQNAACWIDVPQAHIESLLRDLVRAVVRSEQH